MYLKIKQLADEAIALQNKIQMDAALREISAMCEPVTLTVRMRDPSSEMATVVDEIGEHLMAIDAATRTPRSTVDINDVPALVEKARSSITPEKMVVKELAAGKTILLDGQYVKLVRGDAPALQGKLISEGRFPPPELLGGVVADKDGNKSFSGMLERDPKQIAMAHAEVAEIQIKAKKGDAK